MRGFSPAVEGDDFERSNAGEPLEGARDLARGGDHDDDEIPVRDPSSCRIVRLLPGDTSNELVILVDVAPRDVQELDIEACFEALGRCVAVEAVAVDQVALREAEIAFLVPPSTQRSSKSSCRAAQSAEYSAAGAVDMYQASRCVE